MNQTIDYEQSSVARPQCDFGYNRKDTPLLESKKTVLKDTKDKRQRFIMMRRTSSYLSDESGDSCDEDDCAAEDALVLNKFLATMDLETISEQDIGIEEGSFAHLAKKA